MPDPQQSPDTNLDDCQPQSLPPTDLTANSQVNATAIYTDEAGTQENTGSTQNGQDNSLEPHSSDRQLNDKNNNNNDDNDNKEKILGHTHSVDAAGDEEIIPQGPELTLTLLLITGLRITIKMDSHYLASHSSLTAFSDPEQVLIGSFKSCIYSCWQDDWTVAPPTTPDCIRLIYLGKVLQDDQTFEQCKVTNENSHNVIHLSVKPASFELENPDKVKQPKGRFRNRSGQADGESRSSGGCCIIV